MRISDWSSDVCSSDLTTISEMGPLLLARLMGLNEVQEGVLAIALRVADEQNLPLLDMPDLQAMLVWCAENADTLTTRYGNVSKATVGTIQRQLLSLESQGGDHFFGEPALRSEEHTSELQSLMRISYAVFCLKKNKIPSVTLNSHNKIS